MNNTESTLYALMVFFSPLVLAAQMASGQATPEGDKDRNIIQWIDALASPNKAPKERDGGLVMAVDYDRLAQKTVLKAWRSLVQKGIAAFPRLIASVEDQRYSCSARAPCGDVNLTVGDVCDCIIRNQVEIYSDVIDYPLPGAAPLSYVPVDRRTLAQWWQKRQHQSLRELQIEATEYALRSLKDPSAEERRLRDEHPDIKATQAENIPKVEAILRQVKSSKLPISPHTRNGGDLVIIGLPADAGSSGHEKPP